MSIVLYLLSSSIFIFASIKYLDYLLEYRAKNKKYIWMVALFYLCATTMLFFSETDSPINAWLFIAMAVSFGCFFSNWQRIAMVTSFLVVALFVSEAMMFYLIMLMKPLLLLNTSLELALDVGNNISKIILPAVLYIFAKVFHIAFSKEPIPAKYLLGCFSIPFLSVFVFYYISLSSSDESIPIIYSLIAAFVIMAMNTAILLIFIRLTEYYDAKIANQRYLEQIDAFNRQQLNDVNAINSIKQVRHDLNNILLAVKFSLENENVKDALDAIDDHLNETSPAYFVSNTNIYPIDSIINYKNGIAKQTDIRMEVRSHHIEELNISWTDICVIMSNALDNAIEACNRMKSSDTKTIHIIIETINRMLRVSISNPYAGKTLSNRHGGYITIKTDKDNHGFGVNGIMRLLEKNNGFGDIDDANDIFKLTFMVPEKQ